jgi:hypothetical protein
MVSSSSSSPLVNQAAWYSNNSELVAIALDLPRVSSATSFFQYNLAPEYRHIR